MGKNIKQQIKKKVATSGLTSVQLRLVMAGLSLRMSQQLVRGIYNHEITETKLRCIERALE